MNQLLLNAGGVKYLATVHTGPTLLFLTSRWRRQLVAGRLVLYLGRCAVSREAAEMPCNPLPHCCKGNRDV
jgi:hypothetical protein